MYRNVGAVVGNSIRSFVRLRSVGKVYIITKTRNIAKKKLGGGNEVETRDIGTIDDAACY